MPTQLTILQALSLKHGMQYLNKPYIMLKNHTPDLNVTNWRISNAKLSISKSNIIAAVQLKDGFWALNVRKDTINQYLPQNYLTEVTETEVGTEDQVKDSIKEEEHSSNIAENEGEKAGQVEISTIVIINDEKSKKIDKDSTSTNEM
ncbi:hypothetical protein ACTXT7_009038 [Hymenolepis weldensis]